MTHSVEITSAFGDIFKHSAQKISSNGVLLMNACALVMTTERNQFENTRKTLRALQALRFILLKSFVYMLKYANKSYENSTKSIIKIFSFTFSTFGFQEQHSNVMMKLIFTTFTWSLKLLQSTINILSKSTIVKMTACFASTSTMKHVAK